jgi:phage baseplate assembly protein V
MATFHALIRGVHRTLGRTQANVDRLARRVLLLVGRGRVSAPVNDGGAVQMLQAQINPLETIDNLRRIAEFGFTSVPPEGSDVAIVFVGGDRSSGLVIGTNHQGSRPTGLNPGETMIFTQDGKQIYLTASGGIVVEAKGQPVVINDASNVTVNCSGVFKVVAPGGVVFDTPNVSSTGDITDNTGTGNESTMKTMREIHDTHDHDVVEVQTGSSTITTKVPNQQE